jgi:homoserine kinase
MRFSCSVKAPCSTANLGPGYDVFGLALDALYDRVTISRSSSNSAISVAVRGKYYQGISLNPDENSAGLVIKKMSKDFGFQNDAFDLIIDKGVPAGYGMGSSGASAAAAAVAFDNLLELGLEKDRLVQYAAAGEMASAGAAHYDNVSASLLGGFVISRLTGKSPPHFIRLDPPQNLRLVVAVPMVQVPKRKTEVARSVLPSDVSLSKVVHNVSAASAIVAGFAQGDVRMIAEGIDDVVVEPARKNLIAGYDDVKRLALDAGALAVTISGAGPSLISILDGKEATERVSQAMRSGFKKAGLDSHTFACKPSKGAGVIL